MSSSLPPPRTPDADAERRRAQTSIDFVVGMSVFLVAVAFVFAAVPNVFAPFGDQDATAITVDRSAERLADDLLGSPDSPSVLDADCTVEFFDADGSTGGCAFSDDASDLQAALGVDGATGLNVTVEEDGTIRTVDGQDLEAGPEPPESRTVSVARRLVLLGDEESLLVVRAW